MTPWTAAHQASLFIAISLSVLKLMSKESVMPSNHLILCCSHLLPSIFPSIRGNDKICGFITIKAVRTYRLFQIIGAMRVQSGTQCLASQTLLTLVTSCQCCQARHPCPASTPGSLWFMVTFLLGFPPINTRCIFQILHPPKYLPKMLPVLNDLSHILDFHNRYYLYHPFIALSLH